MTTEHNEQQPAGKALQRIRAIASQAGTEQQHGPQFVAGMRRAANLLEKAIAAKPAALPAAPDGYTLAPAEPDVAMVRAGMLFGLTPNQASMVYQSMLLARPQEVR